MGQPNPKHSSYDVALHNCRGVKRYWQELRDLAQGDVHLMVFLAWGHNSTMVERGTRKVFAGKELIARIIGKAPNKFNAEQVLIGWALTLDLDPEQVIGEYQVKRFGADKDKVRTFDFSFLQDHIGMEEERHRIKRDSEGWRDIVTGDDWTPMESPIDNRNLTKDQRTVANHIRRNDPRLYRIEGDVLDSIEERLEQVKSDPAFIRSRTDAGKDPTFDVEYQRRCVEMAAKAGYSVAPADGSLNPRMYDVNGGYGSMMNEVKRWLRPNWVEHDISHCHPSAWVTVIRKHVKLDRRLVSDLALFSSTLQSRAAGPGAKGSQQPSKPLGSFGYQETNVSPNLLKAARNNVIYGSSRRGLKAFLIERGFASTEVDSALGSEVFSALFRLRDALFDRLRDGRSVKDANGRKLSIAMFDGDAPKMLSALLCSYELKAVAAAVAVVEAMPGAHMPTYEQDGLTTCHDDPSKEGELSRRVCEAVDRKLQEMNIDTVMVPKRRGLVLEGEGACNGQEDEGALEGTSLTEQEERQAIQRCVPDPDADGGEEPHARASPRGGSLQRPGRDGGSVLHGDAHGVGDGCGVVPSQGLSGRRDGS